MTIQLEVSRRSLLRAGGALVLGFSLLPAPAQSQVPSRLPSSLAQHPQLDAWIRIGADGEVKVFTGKVELGQGIKTALLQVAAEELEVNPAHVTVITADTERTPDEGYTAGSLSLANSGTALRHAAAQVRGILLGLASAHLGVPLERLRAEDGAVLAADGRRVGYGELVRRRLLHQEAVAGAPVKDPARHRLVGRSMARVDIPAKVTGAPSFVHDLQLPGMLHARVVRPPTYDARLLAIDTASVEATPGVIRVVRDGSYLAVITEREELAERARAQLARAARWTDEATLPDASRLYAELQALPSQETVVREGAAVSAGGGSFEAVYHRPYQMHASLGPSCAVAHFGDGALTVWTHAQGVFPLRRAIAELIGLAPERVRCIHMEGPGCYGHNGADDAAADAALLARHVSGRPVRVQWSRSDEHTWEPYGSAMVMRARAALSESGDVTGFSYDVWSSTHSSRPNVAALLMPAWHLAKPLTPPPPRGIPQPAGGGDRNAIPLYDFPSPRIVNHFIQAQPLRVSALRGLGAYGNVFAIESFVDEIAHAAHADPVAFRLRYLSDPRARAVVESAAERFRWSSWQPRANRGRGFAFARYKNSAAYTAIAMEIEVDAQGTVRILRAVAANDSGEIVNPDGVRNQIEGGIVQSASWTLHEAVRYDDTGILSRDWASYPILRFPETPEIDVVLIDRPGEPFLGTGETAQGPAAGAIANAVFNAVGARVREIPLTPERVRGAMGP
jgi:nicotinate dehydrogenase subunit B